MSTTQLKKKVKLICLIGVALHKYGTNAQRLELCLTFIASYLGLKGNFFSTPTYLAVSIDASNEDENVDQINHHIRINPGDPDLERLQEVDSIADEVCHDGLAIDVAIKRLKALELMPPSYNKFSVFMAYSCTSMALAIILQGGSVDVIFSLLVGSIVGFFAIIKSRSNKLTEIFEFLVAFLVMIACFILDKLQIPFNYQIVLISSLIVIIPGLNLTIAMTELATQHLVSGTARLMGALITFFKISFGILLGIEVGKLGFTQLVAHQTALLPGWAIIPATIIAALSFTVIFNATLRDFKWVLLSGVISLGTLNISQIYFNNTLSIFFAAFIIGVASNLFARLKNRPAAITLLPGIIFIVPGSVGLKGLNLIFQNNLIAGISGGLQMFLIAITIVAGLFLANVCLNPRRVL